MRMFGRGAWAGTGYEPGDNRPSFKLGGPGVGPLLKILIAWSGSFGTHQRLRRDQKGRGGACVTRSHVMARLPSTRLWSAGAGYLFGGVKDWVAPESSVVATAERQEGGEARRGRRGGGVGAEVQGRRGGGR